jgi:phosphatidylglycerophosphate synthase
MEASLSAAPAPANDPARSVERWTRAHAVALLLATGASLLVRNALPAAGVGSASIGVLIALQRGRYTPAGTFGAANVVTAFRLVLIVGLALLGRTSPGPLSALWVGSIFVLDGVDGWIARRTGQASAFGACFDMECDALLVLMCSLVLYLHARLPAFILLPGVLRYLYVLALVLLPRMQEAPRSRIGRYAFGAMVISFVASLWPIEPWHRPLALGASLLILLSFARSVPLSRRSD